MEQITSECEFASFGTLGVCLDTPLPPSPGVSTPRGDGGFWGTKKRGQEKVLECFCGEIGGTQAPPPSGGGQAPTLKRSLGRWGQRRRKKQSQGKGGSPAGPSFRPSAGGICFWFFCFSFSFSCLFLLCCVCWLIAKAAGWAREGRDELSEIMDPHSFKARGGPVDTHPPIHPPKGVR